MSEHIPMRHGSLEDLSAQSSTCLDRYQSMLELHPNIPSPVPAPTTSEDENQVNVGLPNPLPTQTPMDAEMADATVRRSDLGYSYQQCSTAALPD